MDLTRSLLLSLLLLAAPRASGADAPLVAGVFSPPRPAPELGLTASDGSALQLDRYRGKVVALAFGFTSCTEVCPATLAVLASARRQLGSRADELQVVYVTVDPARDDAARMREYLARFDSTFIGGTGTPEQLAAVRESYGVSAQEQIVGGSSSFAHSSFTYLIDRDGNLRALMPFGHAADDYAHDVGILLQR